MATCALVAASNFNAEHFQQAYELGLFDEIYAIDAGFAHLEAIECKPNVALGDFDSLGYVPSCQRVVRHPVHKDKSDLELGMQRAVDYDFDEMVVYGALGGRLDHTLANLQLFAKFAEQGVDITVIGDSYAIRPLVGPDAFDLPLLEQGTVSVFAFTDEAHGVIERGMEYSLDDETLTSRTSRGLSNELVGEPAAVAVEEGTLLVFYPLA
ncbi:MAG: thiamine diphosphokinase [Eggerthellaceae bacterium]|nr:thiamine diphosphokinase [Eggerthellaceae bacterium]